jgi:hypothetical protein
MAIEITNQVRIQCNTQYWYTLEDINIDVGFGGGCTISYWEFMNGTGDKRVNHICVNEEEALAISDAIYKLFKKN